MTDKADRGATAGFPCECGETFETAEDFSNHFDRTGVQLKCILSPAAVKKLRKAA